MWHKQTAVHVLMLSVGPCFIFLRQGIFMFESLVGDVGHGVQCSNMLCGGIKFIRNVKYVYLV